jgi:hypothetical protein
MLTDPSGGLLQVGEVLPLLHIPDFFLPGLFLLIAMRLAPILLTYGLLVRPNWHWADSLFRWSRHHWSWKGSFIIGVVLMIWLRIQGLLIGFKMVKWIRAIEFVRDFAHLGAGQGGYNEDHEFYGNRMPI